MKAAAQIRTVPVPDDRGALAAAIGARDAAAEGLKKATEALSLAKQAVEEAEADLERFSDLDHRIAHARATMVKRGEAGGRLPDDLATEREKRRAAQEQLEENTNALQVLQKEHTEAEQALRSRVAAVTVCAFRVLLREAFELSEELRTVKRREWDLTNRVTAFEELLSTALLPEVRLRLIQQTPTEWSRFLEALQMRQPERIPYLERDPVRVANARWRELHAALVRDPNAPLGE